MNVPPITGEEAFRRLRLVSQKRTLALTLRRAAREACERGESPFKPAEDIRSDPEHWRALMRERGADRGFTAPGDARPPST
jgi:hypothetical protein